MGIISWANKRLEHGQIVGDFKCDCTAVQQVRPKDKQKDRNLFLSAIIGGDSEKVAFAGTK